MWMAEVSSGRRVTGRLLVAVGLVWIFWGFFGEVIELQMGRRLLSLPILPGIVLFFVGRSLIRRSRRKPLPAGGKIKAETPLPRPEPRVSAPGPTREIDRRNPRPVAEPDESEVMVEAFEIPEPELSTSAGTGARKTSAEMVAEARKRFGIGS